IAVTADNAACIIYTSGSTGTPKGIVMPTGALVNLLAWHRTQFPGGPGARVVQFTSISFDVSLQEIFSALLAGKCLLVPDEDVRRDPAAFARWLDRCDATELYAPNVIVDAVCEEALGQGLTLPRFRHAVQAGEALVSTDSLRRFFDEQHGRTLMNHYGPAE